MSTDEAFAAVPRRRFLRGAELFSADIDSPVPIGHGQTNSQPSTVRAMLQLLDVRPGHRVLDVGSGSGWTTALLAWLVGPAGRVIGVERIPSLARRAQAALAAFDMPWADVRLARPGTLGWPEDGPYDRILVSAMSHELPDRLVAQLVLGGVLVIPVGGTIGEMIRVVHTSGPIVVERHGWYSFVPLIEDDPRRMRAEDRANEG